MIGKLRAPLAAALLLAACATTRPAGEPELEWVFVRYDRGDRIVSFYGLTDLERLGDRRPGPLLEFTEVIWVDGDRVHVEEEERGYTGRRFVAVDRIIRVHVVRASYVDSLRRRGGG